MATYRQLKDFKQTCPACGETRIVWRSNKHRSVKCRKCARIAQTKKYADARHGCRPGCDLRRCIDCQKPWEARKDSKATRCKSCATKESSNRPTVKAFRSERFKGERSNFWKGGVTGEHERQRREAKYREWRRAVFTRDGYTCQLCGIVGGKLHADHIQPFATHPELRLDVSNGRTLCVPCHRQTDTFGNKRRKERH